MKLLVQSPTASGPDNPIRRQLRGYMLAAVEKVKRPDTELVFQAGTGMEDMRGFAELGLRYRNDAAILESLLTHARDPAIDAVINHCYWDSALWPARQMLDKPVVGLAEASIGLAAHIGRRFAIIVANRRFVQGYEDMLLLYGARSRAIGHQPVRATAADETTCAQWLAEGRIEQLRPQVEQAIAGCIADGADVILYGCGLTSVLVSEVLGMRDYDGVPVITPIVAAVKLAETLVDLQRAGLPYKSARGYWGVG